MFDVSKNPVFLLPLPFLNPELLQYRFYLSEIPGFVRLERVGVIPGEFSQAVPLYPESVFYRRPKTSGNPVGVAVGPLEIFSQTRFAFQPFARFRAGNFYEAFPGENFQIGAELGKRQKTLKQRPFRRETAKQKPLLIKTYEKRSPDSRSREKSGPPRKREPFASNRSLCSFPFRRFRFFHRRKNADIAWLRIFPAPFRREYGRLCFRNAWYVHRVGVGVPLRHPLRLMPRDALHLLNRQPLPLQFGVQEMPPTVQRQPPPFYLFFAYPNLPESAV